MDVSLHVWRKGDIAGATQKKKKRESWDRDEKFDLNS